LSRPTPTSRKRAAPSTGQSPKSESGAWATQVKGTFPPPTVEGRISYLFDVARRRQGLQICRGSDFFNQGVGAAVATCLGVGRIATPGISGVRNLGNQPASLLKGKPVGRLVGLLSTRSLVQIVQAIPTLRIGTDGNVGPVPKHPNSGWFQPPESRPRGFGNAGALASPF
jgi:hypothetical protein